MNSFVSSASSLPGVAGSDLGARRQDRADLRGESIRRDAGFARPGSGRACPACRTAAGRSKVEAASVAPPMLTAPNLTSPETRSRSTGPSAWTPICSPILRSFFSAVDLSTTTSPAFGHAPSTRVERVELRLRRIDAEAEVRCASEDDCLAVLPDSCASPRRRRSPPHVRQRLEPPASSDSSKAAPSCSRRSRGRTPTCR